MNLKKRWAALLLAGVLAAGLATPVLAGEKTAAAVGDPAIQAAGQYGGAERSSIQYALWEDGAVYRERSPGKLLPQRKPDTFSRHFSTGSDSVSKLYTTVAVLQLAEAGKVELDKPVTDYLPDFKMAERAVPGRHRVRMLLRPLLGADGMAGIVQCLSLRGRGRPNGGRRSAARLGGAAPQGRPRGLQCLLQ